MNIDTIKMILQDPIIEKFDINHNQKFKLNSDCLKNLNNKYLTKFQFSEIKYLIKNKNNLSNITIFCRCGNKNLFNKDRNVYAKYCCRKCANSDPDMIRKIQLIKTTTINKDGLNINQLASKKGIESGKNNIDEFGRNSYQRGNIKGRQTKKERHGDPNWNNVNKSKKTCLERVGKISYNKLPEYRENLSRFWQDENWKNNNIKNNKISKFINHGDENYNNIEQAQKTMLIRFGANVFTKTQQFKNLYKNKEWVAEIQEKWRETRKKNGYNKMSLPEQIIAQYLIQKFPDLEYIHRDKRYPFNCDFYIKSEDLYIEVNFAFEHHTEKFDKNNIEHINILQDLYKSSEELIKQDQTKIKNRYLSKIYVWTVLDPKKQIIAKQNSLNYKVFYNYEQFLDWFSPLIDTPDM